MALGYAFADRPFASKIFLVRSLLEQEQQRLRALMMASEKRCKLVAKDIAHLDEQLDLRASALSAVLTQLESENALQTKAKALKEKLAAGLPGQHPTPAPSAAAPPSCVDSSTFDNIDPEEMVDQLLLKSGY